MIIWYAYVGKLTEKAVITYIRDERIKQRSTLHYNCKYVPQSQCESSKLKQNEGIQYKE